MEQSDAGEPGWNRFGFVLSWNERNLEGGSDLGSLRDFVRVEFDFYAELR